MKKHPYREPGTRAPEPSVRYCIPPDVFVLVGLASTALGANVVLHSLLAETEDRFGHLAIAFVATTSILLVWVLVWKWGRVPASLLRDKK